MSVVLPMAWHWRSAGLLDAPFILPFHRGRRVPGHWPENRFVTSDHGPVSCLSSTDEFCPTPGKCSMSVRSNRQVLIKQNRPMTKVQRVWKSSSDVCSNEISGQCRFTHRLHRAPSADSDYPPATDLPHLHVMLSSHRRQDTLVIRRPLRRIYATRSWTKHPSPSSDSFKTSDLMFRVYTDPSQVRDFCLGRPCSSLSLHVAIASDTDVRVHPRLCNTHAQSRRSRGRYCRLPKMVISSGDIRSEPRV